MLQAREAVPVAAEAGAVPVPEGSELWGRVWLLLSPWLRVRVSVWVRVPTTVVVSVSVLVAVRVVSSPSELALDAAEPGRVPDPVADTDAEAYDESAGVVCSGDELSMVVRLASQPCGPQMVPVAVPSEAEAAVMVPGRSELVPRPAVPVRHASGVTVTYEVTAAGHSEAGTAVP